MTRVGAGVGTGVSVGSGSRSEVGSEPPCRRSDPDALPWPLIEIHKAEKVAKLAHINIKINIQANGDGYLYFEPFQCRAGDIFLLMA